MTIALLGVFVMQLYYIKEAYDLKSQLFDEQVNQTLNTVVSKVQRLNVASNINKKEEENRLKQEEDLRDREFDIKTLKQDFAQDEEIRKSQQQAEIENYLNQQDSLIHVLYKSTQVLTEKAFKSLSTYDPKMGKSLLDVQVDAVVDKNYNLKGYSMRSKLASPDNKTFNFRSLITLPDSIRYYGEDRTTGSPALITLPKISEELEKKFTREDRLAKLKYEQTLSAISKGSKTYSLSGSALLQDVEKEMREVNVPIYKRINFNDLNLLLSREFVNHNIFQRYDMQVKLAQKDSVLFLQASNPNKTFQDKDTYRVPLFGNDLFRDPGILEVNFPNKNSAIISNLSATLASSIGLLLVLVFIFSYTLYAILQQKKISEMKTDFINNMTHEFKTPVATIMIASEALKDSEVTEDKARLKRLAGIIYDENVRLGNHIERVLSIARLEKNEIKMENEEVDMNDLVTIVLDSMSLQLQKKNATIHLHTEASNAKVMGDELHLSNVLYNLIDNANKYSAENPEITITTRNTAKNLIVEISDKGIGMTKEQSKRIFDQFYRVPTGNLHDVKGFGLGLNYVQDIIKKLNGTIKVHSEKDIGTTFEISLPL